MVLENEPIPFGEWIWPAVLFFLQAAFVLGMVALVGGYLIAAFRYGPLEGGDKTAGDSSEDRRTKLGCAAGGAITELTRRTTSRGARDSIADPGRVYTLSRSGSGRAVGGSCRARICDAVRSDGITACASALGSAEALRAGRLNQVSTVGAGPSALGRCRR